MFNNTQKRNPKDSFQLIEEGFEAYNKGKDINNLIQITHLYEDLQLKNRKLSDINSQKFIEVIRIIAQSYQLIARSIFNQKGVSNASILALLTSARQCYELIELRETKKFSCLESKERLLNEFNIFYVDYLKISVDIEYITKIQKAELVTKSSLANVIQAHNEFSRKFFGRNDFRSIQEHSYLEGEINKGGLQIQQFLKHANFRNCLITETNTVSTIQTDTPTVPLNKLRGNNNSNCFFAYENINTDEEELNFAANILSGFKTACNQLSQ